MRLIYDETTLDTIKSAKNEILENQSTVIVDKCIDDKIKLRILLRGDYKPFSAEELKRKYNAPKFEIRIIEYKNDDFAVDYKDFLRFDEAYEFFILLVEQLDKDEKCLK